MALFGDDADREQFFEAARQQAQREFEADNANVQALVRWGGAMLELAHFKQGDESTDMIKEAISKLQQAIALDGERPDAYWCLGNAYTSLGFLCPDKSKALQNFDEAKKAFKHCADKEPNNETYKKALEMCEKAPEYYDEIQSHIAMQGGPGGDGGKGKGGAAGGVQISDFWFDVGGWVILGAVVVGALLLAKGSAPKPTAS
ncbi:hypothetical protein CHLRE_12g534600v5 [Chlamydomonas reinhardtii]|uniref:Uncharacterized protein n=1 Tax=Chlamydomonas reinhardtii TaxID=3055 RepID=A8IVN6_CHLRE|nr:uncharacterized protein CHLRE_12g534600v5 [Chlamydomonas reinhardtii]PNW75629.1 hypothetical protein CHLRE_12g534600v5 [Chlamydomonas reinhardtii]|eukprot:XP_001692995.1 translocase of outer mitochondrial membrane [Chlamydomonas reinhardtii]